MWSCFETVYVSYDIPAKGIPIALQNCNSKKRTATWEQNYYKENTGIVCPVYIVTLKYTQNKTSYLNHCDVRNNRNEPKSTEWSQCTVWECTNTYPEFPGAASVCTALTGPGRTPGANVRPPLLKSPFDRFRLVSCGENNNHLCISMKGMLWYTWAHMHNQLHLWNRLSQTGRNHVHSLHIFCSNITVILLNDQSYIYFVLLFSIFLLLLYSYYSCISE